MKVINGLVFENLQTVSPGNGEAFLKLLANGETVRATLISWDEITDRQIFNRTVSGLVPSPGGSTTTRYLREDGTWQTPPNTTYSEITEAESDSASSSTARLITGRRLNSWASRQGFLTSLPSHTHAASDITSGVLATARLGSGTANNGVFLRGDGTWNAVAWGNLTGVPTTFAPAAHNLNSHSDVSIASVATGQLLRWNGTAWANWTPNFLTSFTETDPTVPTHVKAITAAQITNWNAAHGWGDFRDFGLGVNTVSIWSSLSNAESFNQGNRFVSASSAANTPFTATGVGINFSYGSLRSSQLWLNNNGTLQFRTTSANSSWAPVRTVWDNINLDPSIYAVSGTGGSQVRNNTQLDDRYIQRSGDTLTDDFEFRGNFRGLNFADLNNVSTGIVNQGFRLFRGNFQASNRPSASNWVSGFEMNSIIDSGRRFSVQVAVQSTLSESNSLLVRSVINNNNDWSPWRVVWHEGNHSHRTDAQNDARYLLLSGGTMSGNLGLHGTSSNFFTAGTGDGATFSTFNFALRGWNGMAFQNGSASGAVTGVINFRTGVINMLGGFQVNGSNVWHAGNLNPSSFAASSHTHNASDITSGLINTARLGSGTANSNVFLRGDGVWAAAEGSVQLRVAGVADIGAVWYNGQVQSGGRFYGGNTAPTQTSRLNYSGNFVATNLLVSTGGRVGAVADISNETSFVRFNSDNLELNIGSGLSQQILFRRGGTTNMAIMTHNNLTLAGTLTTGAIRGTAVPWRLGDAIGIGLGFFEPTTLIEIEVLGTRFEIPARPSQRG
ncbi:MAG: hypothetical protein ACXIUD_09830 [Mongoliitalea sp.]